jgi:alpha-glucosidase (family GH31 glycosyl hydrolase)
LLLLVVLPICLRWGYNDVQVLEQVVANYSAAGIPLEALWLDIEYMGNRFKTLTFDKGAWRVTCLGAGTTCPSAVG